MAQRSPVNPILLHGRIGVGGSSARPFFVQVDAVEKRFRDVPSAHAHMPPLPDDVRDAIAFVGPDDELYVGTWTFLSPNAIRERHREVGRNDVVPFAHQYMGLGHVRCLGYFTTEKIVFTYADGGSNGYDRAHNLTRLQQMSPSQMREASVGGNLVAFLTERAQ